MVALTPLLPNTDRNLSDESSVEIERRNILALQGQISNIQSEVAGINSGLNSIGSLIKKDSLLEESRLLEEQKREKISAERQLRIGAEKEIEKRIDATLSQSVKNLEPKLTSVFDSISRSIRNLFGFLAIGTIPLISKISSFAIKGLTNVKNFVTKSLGFVTSTISSLKNGFSNIAKSVGNIIGKISGIALNLVKSPIKFVADAFKKIPGLGSGTSSAVSSTASVSSDDILSKIFKTGGKALSSGIGGVASAAVDIATGEDPKRAIAGGVGTAIVGSLGARLGSSLGPVGTITAGISGSIFGGQKAKELYDTVVSNFNPSSFTSNLEKPNKSTPSPNTPNPITSNTTNPITSNTTNPSNVSFVNTVSQNNQSNISNIANSSIFALNTASTENSNSQEILNQKNETNLSSQENVENKLTQNMSNIFNTNIRQSPGSTNPIINQSFSSIFSGITTFSTLRNDNFAKNNNVLQSEIKIDPNNKIDGENNSLITPAAQISPPPKQNNTAATISSLPEQKPEIIVASTLPQNQKRTQKPQSTQSDPLTDVILVSSSNIDNFYTLYSQLNYNVII